MHAIAGWLAWREFGYVFCRRDYCAYVVHIDTELSAIHFEAIACMHEDDRNVKTRHTSNQPITDCTMGAIAATET